MIIIGNFSKFKIKTRRFIAKKFIVPILFIYKIKFQFVKFGAAPPIIILTPGKVGSSSVYFTLKGKIPNKVFHIHYLSSNGILEAKEQHLKSDRKSIPLHLIISGFLNDKLAKYNGEVNIITIVREPISRQISSFFQNIDFYKSSIESESLDIDINKSINILNDLFEDNICQKSENWFEQEIHKNFGIDVFMQPFNEKKNYMIFLEGRYKLLLMKMETIDQIFSKAIQEFLSKDAPIYLKKSNIGENKHYAKRYIKIKKEFKIDSNSLEGIVSSKYFKHFYSVLTDEIKLKWSSE